MNKGFFIKNLEFDYKDHDFFLEVKELLLEKNKFVSVIGPNGSGKSTFLKLLSCHEKNFSGDISIYGKNVKKISSRDFARLCALLPQECDKGENYRVFDIVMMGRYPHLDGKNYNFKNEKNIVFNAMKEAGAQSFQSRYFSSLSGGEKKRVLIASVIAQDTDFLLLDEPSSSLDISGQAEIFSLLRDIKNNGKGVVVATHNINLASFFSDYIVLFKKGKILKQGTPFEVINEKYLKKAYGENISIIKNPELENMKIVLPGIRGGIN
ncbi:MAG: ABC transporter ATP-binding protein [Desulfobacteraceae bacterium]|nr:ABC transporter ATP-binding protein [Desulfobacteraceae bacterium]